MTTVGNGSRGADAPLLELENVSSAYGPFRAIFDVSFSLPDGSATALLGPNGAGKSTVARRCTGLVPVTSGHIRYDGRDITGLPAWRMARIGIAHAPEGRSVFSSLTVEENLELTFRQALGRRHMGEALDRNSAKKLPAGSFGYWPAGMKHTAWSEGETVIQLHGIGPWQINYVNPADDPRNAKK